MPPVTGLGWMDRWPRSHPHPERAWTIEGGGRYGSLEPETGRVWPVVPRRDRRLPGLAAALDEGATLVGYRVGRRAVLRQGPRPGGRWTKVVRPSRAAALAALHEYAVTAIDLGTPEPVASHGDGRVELTTVPGRSLHEIIRTEPVKVAAWLPVVANGLEKLHRSNRFGPDRYPDLPERSLRIVERAEPSVFVPFRAGTKTSRRWKVGPRPWCTAICTKERRAVVEDDVANLAVHLELRVLQLRVETTWAEQLLAAYPGPLDLLRLAAARRHTYLSARRPVPVPGTGAWAERRALPAGDDALQLAVPVDREELAVCVDPEAGDLTQLGQVVGPVELVGHGAGDRVVAHASDPTLAPVRVEVMSGELGDGR
ncbi:MAG: hypothetical protein OEW83_11720, partial [Acidimicrobiia bacterium]|nr:hypothetical protein [Acidimicrobiia bacterium]